MAEHTSRDWTKQMLRAPARADGEVSGSSSRYPWGDGPLERKDLLTAAQVGELLGLRQGTVEDYARRHVFPSFKIGKHRRFVRAQVEARLVELLDRPS